MRKVIVVVSLLAAVLVSIVGASPAEAGGATITVTTNVDELNGTGDNVISIREAVGLAATDGGPSTIVIPAGDYSLTRCATAGNEDEDANVNGDLDQTVVQDLSFERPVADAGLQIRIHQTCGGERLIDTAGSIMLDFVDLDGGSPAGSGGAIQSDGHVTVFDGTIAENETDASGGGIYANESVSLGGTSVQGNVAGADGGGIRAGGFVVVDEAQVIGNVAGGNGGGIRGLGGGDVTVNRGLVGRNEANDGAGIYLEAGGSVVLDDATVAQNVASNGVGGIYAPDQVVASQSTVANSAQVGGTANIETATLAANETVVADPVGGPSCSVGATTSDGYNVEEGDTSCGFDALTDLSNTGDPGLLPLFRNGGPTETMFLRSTSFLRELAPTTSNGCSNGGEDQRGIDRPQGGLCDVGAVEVEPCGSFFGDVSGTHPFCWEIGWMSAAGVTTGFPGTPPTYKPSSPVTRQSMSAFLFRLAGSPDVAVPMTPTFSDVGTTHPFYDEIEWMAGEGISTGTPGTPKPSYKPADAVSRQAMSAFMFRLVDPPSMVPTITTFSDVSTNHPFFEEIEWMAAEGITTGFVGSPKPSYKPGSPVTRQSMSAFMFRLAPVLTTAA